MSFVANNNPDSRNIQNFFPSKINDLRQKDAQLTHEQIQNLSWLQQKDFPHQIDNELDFAFFARLDADGFTAGTPLKETSFEDAAKYFLKAIDSLIHQPQNALFSLDASTLDALTSYKNELKFMLENLNAMNAAVKEGEGKNSAQRREIIKKLAVSLKTKFAARGKGWLPCLMSSGMYKKSPLIYQLDMKDSLTILNTGEGHEKHGSIQQSSIDPLTGEWKEEVKFQDFLKVRPKKEKLHDPEFFEALLESHIRPQWEYGTQLGADFIYKGILGFLDAKPEAPIDPKKHPEAFKKANREETNTIKCFTSSLYYHLHHFGQKKNHGNAALDFKKCKFIWQMSAFLAEAEKLRNSAEPVGEKSLQLMEDTVDNLLRSAEKLQAKGDVFTEDKLQRINVTMKDITQLIRQKREDAETFVTDMANRDPAVSADFNYTVANDRVNARTRINTLDHIAQYGHLHANQNIAVAAHAGIPTIDATDLFMNPENILNDLNRCNAVLDQAEANTYHSMKNFVKLRLFSEILRALPIPKSKNQDPFWSRVPADRLELCMEAINKLSSHFILQNKYPLQTVASFTCLALTDFLARRDPDSGLDDSHTVYHHDLIVKAASPNFKFELHHEHEKAMEIVRYFKPDYVMERHINADYKPINENLSTQLFSHINIDDHQEKCRIDEKTMEKDPTLVFYKKFLGNLEADYLQHSNFNAIDQVLIDSPVDKMAVLLEHASLETGQRNHLGAPDKRYQNKQLIPKSILYLQQAAYNSQMAARDVTIMNSKGFRYLHRSLFENPSRAIYMGFPSYSGSRHFFEEDYLEMVGKDNKSDYRDFIRSNKAEKFTQNDVIFKEECVFDLDREISLDLNMVCIDPFDEANRIIAFCENHLSLLDKPHIRTLIRLHLFRFGRLNSQLMDNPAYVNKIIKFIDNCFAHHYKFSNFETCAFLTHLGRDLTQFCKEAGSPIQFPDYREKLLKEILPQLKTNSEKMALFETVLKMHLNDPESLAQDKEKFSELAIDIYQYIAFEVLVSKSASNDEGIIYLLRRYKNMIDDKLAHDPEFRQLVLNEMLKAAIPDAAVNCEWEQIDQSKVYVQVNGECKIDLNTFRVQKINGEMVTDLPYEYKNNDAFQKLVKGDIAFVVKDPNLNKYTIHPQKIIIEGPTFSPRFSYEAENGDLYILIPGPNEIAGLAPHLFDNKFFWFNSTAKDHILIKDVEGKEVFRAQVEEVPGQPNSRIEKFYNILNVTQGNKRLLSLSAITDRTLQAYLSKLEPDALKIEVWGSAEDGSLQTIKLPDQGLEFNVKDGKAYCRNYPGYYISSQRFEYSLGMDAKYLALEKSPDEKKLVVAKGEVGAYTVVDNNGRLVSHVNFRYGQTPQEWFDYTIKDGRWSAQKTQAILFQALIAFAKGEYEEAKHLVEKTGSLKRYSKKELEILKNMLALAQADRHPSAIALALSLVIKAEENLLKFRPSNFETVEPIVPPAALLPSYQLYAAHSGNSSNLRLTVQEEKRIVYMIETYLKDRIKEAKDKREKMLEKAKHKEEKILEYELKTIQALLARRKAYWETGKGDIGSLEMPQMPDFDMELVNISSYELQEYLEAQPGLVFPDFWVSPKGSEFRIHFTTLYHIARSGKKEDKARLRKLLKLNKHVTGVDARFKTVIEMVLNHPWFYPTLDSLRKARIQRDMDLAKYPQNDFKNNSKRYSITEGYRRRFVRLSGTLTFFSAISKLVKVVFMAIGMYFSRLKKTKAGTFKKVPKMINHNKLLCDNKKLQEADRDFNKYFKGLLSAYFNEPAVEKVKAEVVEQLPIKETDSANVKKKLETENADLKAYRENEVKFFSLKPDKQLETESLEENIKYWKESLKTQASGLVWLANRVSSKGGLQVLKEIHKQGNRKKVDWTDLQKMFLNGTWGAFRERAELSPIDTYHLFNGVADYLVKKSRLNQMELALKTMKMIRKVPDGEQYKLKKDSLILLLGQILDMERGYKPSDETKEALFFEVANGYLYRENQIAKMKEILEADSRELVVELPTGYGKTKALVPSLNNEKAKEGKLVVNTWPASLEFTNARDVKETMESSFATGVDRLFFDRNTKFDINSLTYLYEELKKDIREKRPLNLRSEALRAMELHMLLLLNEIQNGSNKAEDRVDIEAKADLLIKILRLIRLKGWSTIDESHKTLEPLDKLIYTLGEPERLPYQHVEFIQEMFRVLCLPEVMAKTKIDTNNQYLLDDKGYAEIQQLLADHFAQLYEVDDAIKQEYYEFVLGKGDKEPAWLKGHKRCEEISLLKGQLCYILKSSLHGSVDENYGLSKLHFDKIEFAISYFSANTPKENNVSPSQFKNPHETLNKTYLTYLYKGLALTQAKKLMDMLKEIAVKEMEEGVSIEESEVHSLFKKIIPDYTKPLNGLSKADMEALYPQIKHNRDAIFYYINNVVAPQIKVYPLNLVSNVQAFKSMFDETTSFSATPLSDAAHSVDAMPVPMIGTSGHVTHLMLAKCKDPRSLQFVDGSSPEKALEGTLRLMGEGSPVRAVIDVGALFKGMTNREAAEKIADHYANSEDMEAVLFFDEKDQHFKVLNIHTRSVFDINECLIDPEKRQTLYDQSRTYGSDIVQMVDAVAKLLIAKGALKSNVGQGAGRMRQLHRDQKVEIVIPEQIREEIFGKGETEITELLRYWIANQANAEANTNYLSQPQQMENEIRRPIIDEMFGIPVGKKLTDEEFDRIIDQKPDIGRAVSLLNANKREFFSEESLKAYEMYRAIPKEKDTIEHLRDIRAQIEKRIKKAKMTRQAKKYALNRLATKYEPQWQKMLKPEKVLTASIGLDMECEVLEEVEVQLQVNLQMQAQNNDAKRPIWNWPKDMDIYKKGWEKPERDSAFARKVREIFHNIARFFGRTSEKFVNVLKNNRGLTSFIVLITGVVLPILAGVIVWLPGKLVQLHYSRKINGMRKVPLFQMKDVLSYHLPRKMKKASNFFSSKFLVSNNFETQQLGTFSELVQKPFTKEQKPLYELLVIEDVVNGKKEITVMAIDQNDSRFFREKLQKDREVTSREAAEKRSRKIAIYDLKNGIVSQGKNAFAEGELEGSKQFNRLLAEAKLFNGEIRYTEEQLKYIGKKSAKVGKSEVGKMFREQILPQRSRNMAAFKKVPIGRVFAPAAA